MPVVQLNHFCPISAKKISRRVARESDYTQEMGVFASEWPCEMAGGKKSTKILIEPIRRKSKATAATRFRRLVGSRSFME